MWIKYISGVHVLQPSNSFLSFYKYFNKHIYKLYRTVPHFHTSSNNNIRSLQADNFRTLYEDRSENYHTLQKFVYILLGEHVQIVAIRNTIKVQSH